MSRKRLLSIVISLILALNVPLYVSADKISDLKKEKAETQKQLDEATAEVNELTKVQKGITDEIEAIDDELVEVLAAVSMVEDEIADLEIQIEIAQADYEAAVAEEESQYNAMKARIKFMYEKGDYTYVELLMESKGLSDLVNKTEYIEKLYEYDRKMLIKYQEAKEAVAEAKAALEEQEMELEASKYELEQEKAALDELMAEKKAEAEDYENQISKAKQEAAAYKAKIKQQNAQIKKLEQEEAARRAAAAAANKKTGSSYSLDSASVINGANGSASGKEIASYACRYVGNPYVPGGTSLTNGADCSGFTYAVYKAFGYNIPRNSTAQRSAGRGVSYSEAEPGDIICYAGHVAIYLGGGRIVHASTPATGIKYGVATYKEILGVRRIVN